MRLEINSELLDLLDLIRSVADVDQELYLVGGAVRDALLGRQLHDFDFVIPKNPTSLAKRLANRLGAGFFVLDDERHTARVVHHLSDGDAFPLDFVQFTGEDLSGDLHNRDFTINAMAIAIQDLGRVIDPLDGQADLEAGVIRACSSRALLDDPVRVLRGVRMAMQFKFHYADNLPDLMRDAAAHLPETSYERQRDVFLMILEGDDPSTGVKHCREFGVFDTLIPPLLAQETVPASPPHVLPLFDHTVQVVAYYDRLLQHLHPSELGLEQDPWWLKQVSSDLKCFSKEITEFFIESVTPGRKKCGLALLGALLHDLGKPQTMQQSEAGHLQFHNHEKIGADLAYETAKRLQLSNAECEWLRLMVRHHMRLLSFLTVDSLPNRRSIYRFFGDVGEVGVPIALLFLADTLATYGVTLPTALWRKTTSIVKVMLSAWWEGQETVISPPTLLNGDDLQKMFNLQPGKRIGILLADLAEAQASGEILTEEQAREFIRARLIK